MPRDKLSPDELTFVGVFPEARPSPGGWVQPSESTLLQPLYDLGAEPRPEDVEILNRLMSVGTSAARVEFMG